MSHNAAPESGTTTTEERIMHGATKGAAPALSEQQSTGKEPGTGSTPGRAGYCSQCGYRLLGWFENHSICYDCWRDLAEARRAEEDR